LPAKRSPAGHAKLAQTTWIWPFFLSIPLNQLVNIFVILAGGGVLKVK
jgi:hypothetical protein